VEEYVREEKEMNPQYDNKTKNNECLPEQKF
jgi:hypothetical protein